MVTNYYEILLKLASSDSIEHACQELNKKKSFPGFRKGRTPSPIILNLSKNVKSLQHSMCASIASSVFAKQTPEDIIKSHFEISDENLFAYLATYIFMNKENEFPYSIEQLNALIPPDVPITVKDSNHVNEGITTPAVSLTENNNSDSFSSDKNAVPETDQTAIPKEEKQLSHTGGKKMQYLGYIQVVTPDFSSFSYYNFYPIAVLEDNNRLRIMDYYERRDTFPEKCNVNIYSASRNDDRLSSLFRNGDILIIDITEDIIQENRKSNNELNITNKKIEVATLEATNSIHFPDEFGLFPVIYFGDARTFLGQDKLIHLNPEDTIGFYYDEPILLEDASGDLIGPFMLASDTNTNTYYINPQSEQNNFLFNVYRAQNVTNNFVTFQIPESEHHGAINRDVRYVNTTNINRELVDFIPKEALVQALGNILAARNEESSEPVIESAFAGIELPNDIVSARRESLINIFSQIHDVNGMVNSISSIVSDLLIDAANDDKEQFDEVFKTLADNPKFLLRIQRYRRIVEAIDAKESQLAQLNTEFAETLKKKDETEQQLESKRSSILTESIQAKQTELANVESELTRKLEALKLTENIQALQVKHGVLVERNKDAQQEYDDIHLQTQKILATFRSDVEEPMAKIAHVSLNAEIESIISEAADKALQNKAQDPNRPAKRYADQLAAACDTTLNKDNIVDEICKRITAYRSYSKNDVINLLICLTQGFLTVFSGAPGTGKTSICKIIAHSLGLDTNNSDNPQQENLLPCERYVVVPVERGWSSKRDFIGYYNPLTKNFDKANSEIYRALEISNIECDMILEAKKDNRPEPIMPPSVIMLDEANLSPMEYYWADFMSVCDDGCRNAVISLSEHDRFKVASSLRFMATINNDHTTESLSPRLIDRAWVISLPLPTSPRITHFNEHYNPISMSALKQVFDISTDDLSLDTVSDRALKDIFEACREKLSITISPRTELAIRRYCKVGSGLFEDTKSGIDAPIVAIDYAVAQKILPKIQGSGAAYKKSLEEFNQEALQKNNLLNSSELLNRIIQRGDKNMQYYQYFS